MAHCTFILIRHGETYWNKKKKMQGQVNIPLNENGIKQAEKLAQKLNSYSFDICYCSPLVRSVRTAEIVCRLKKTDIIKDEKLIEQNYGICEGQSQRFAFNVPFCKMYAYVHNPEKYVAPAGGESFQNLMLRSKKVISDIMTPAALKYNTVLISAHGAILCSILCNIDNVSISEFWRLKLSNCGYAIVEWIDGKWKIKGIQ